ncbi:MAG: porin family protein [Sphaerochaeta sp.]
MKKHILISLLVLVFAVSAISAGTLKAGVSVGGNVAFVGTEPSGDGTPRYGFTGGVYGEYDFYSLGEMVDLSVQSGLYYTMKGFRTEVDVTPTVSTDLSLNNDYIEMPMLLKASFSLDLPASPYIRVGPSVGYRIINDPSTDPEIAVVEAGAEDKFTNFDAGIVFGAGADLDMGLSIDARFNLGLLNIEDDPSGDNYTKNRSVSLMVSYSIL